MTPHIPSILVVDDEDNVFSAIRRSLRKEGYELTHARDPEEAFQQLALRPYEVVLSDHLMPGMTGLEFLTLVRNRYPDAVRLMLTGHADMQTAIDAINRGNIFRFLSKPWDELELKAALHFALEHQRDALETRRLLSIARNEGTAACQLEMRHPGITHVARTRSGVISLEDEGLDYAIG